MSESHKILVFDGHNDTLLDLYMPSRGGGRSFFELSDKGHLDLPRAKQGGFGGGFFAIFVPRKKRAKPSAADADPPPEPRPIEAAYAQKVTQGMIELLLQLENEANGQLKIVRDSDEIGECFASGALAAILHFEGAEAINPDLSNLIDFYDLGLRSIGLTWSRSNAFAHGVPFEFPKSPDTGPGLTAAGKALVKECNELGVMIDLSHLNEKGFWDVAALSDSPLVATHSGVHEICASTRNLTDKQLDAIGNSGGIVGINFHVGFLRPDGKGDADTPLSFIVDHVQYVADRIGIDHVALGSDFDGARMPAPLGDAAGLPKLIAALGDAGFDEADLRKIGHGNWQRVLDLTWRN
ncbi:MAG: dipeptidase [Chloroflexota bacterium]|nr:MAG: dipeptidase [Chloroflexota bacterium]